MAYTEIKTFVVSCDQPFCSTKVRIEATAPCLPYGWDWKGSQMICHYCLWEAGETLEEIVPSMMDLFYGSNEKK